MSLSAIPGEPEVQEENFRTAAESAYTVIRQKILAGEFKPGEALSRRKMASVTGFSVIPVGEALKRLEEDMLVESSPKWGADDAVLDAVTFHCAPTYSRFCRTSRIVTHIAILLQATASYLCLLGFPPRKLKDPPPEIWH
jgi:DNA-binding transcriptional MocR family regulator